MAINRQTLLAYAPIKGMLTEKVHAHGVSHGMSEAGYDIRIKQEITFCRDHNGGRVILRDDPVDGFTEKLGRFVTASAIEEFEMPSDLMAIVHDKSSWARKGLSVFNTVLEPGWKGFLTLELVYHGEEDLVIPAGAGIAQVVFHPVSDHAHYDGRYQNQEDRPVDAIDSRLLISA